MTKPHLRLWLLRHARPQVEPGVCYGASDVPTDTAHAQRIAHDFVQALHAQGARPIGVWVSERQRTQTLAQRVLQNGADCGWSVTAAQVDPRLNEYDFGSWEGQRWRDIAQADYDTWVNDFAHHRFGGRDSTGELVARVHAALQDLGQLAGGDVVWVTHAGVIRAVNWLQQHAPDRRAPAPIDRLRADQWPMHAPDYGQWQCIDIL